MDGDEAPVREGGRRREGGRHSRDFAGEGECSPSLPVSPYSMQKHRKLERLPSLAYARR